jgi:hypothetical protein
LERLACCIAGEAPFTNSKASPPPQSLERLGLHAASVGLAENAHKVDAVETCIDFKAFRREALELLRLLANLDEVNVPYLCGSYLRFVVVRAGRLE